VRRYLEDQVYEEFARLGRILDDRYRNAHALGADDAAALDEDLTRLSDRIYTLNLMMIAAVGGVARPSGPNGDSLPGSRSCPPAAGSASAQLTARVDRSSPQETDPRTGH
jgi:hypothetical protein